MFSSIPSNVQEVQITGSQLGFESDFSHESDEFRLDFDKFFDKSEMTCN